MGENESDLTEVMRTVRIEEWSIGRSKPKDPYKPPEQRSFVLNGCVYGHPKFADGKRVSTSAICRSCGNTVETMNNTYRLGKPSPDYVRWYEEKYGRPLPAAPFDH